MASRSRLDAVPERGATAAAIEMETSAPAFSTHDEDGAANFAEQAMESNPLVPLTRTTAVAVPDRDPSRVSAAASARASSHAADAASSAPPRGGSPHPTVLASSLSVHRTHNARVSRHVDTECHRLTQTGMSPGSGSLHRSSRARVTRIDNSLEGGGNAESKQAARGYLASALGNVGGGSGGRTTRSLHSEHHREPQDAAVEQTLMHVRRKNCALLFVLLVIIIVLATAGGAGIGVVNNHFTTMTKRSYLEGSNRVILNSSIMLLRTYQEALQGDARNLMTFARSNLNEVNPLNVSVLLDAMYLPFFDAWWTWLFTSNFTASHSIYVPMCAESEINRPGCPIMALTIACLPNGTAQMCAYMHTDVTEPTRMIVNAITFNATGVPQIGSFLKYIPLVVNYEANQTDSQHGFFLNPGYGTSMDGTPHSVLTMRRQEQINGLIVICDSGSYLEKWFRKFDRALQKTEDSYSMIFRDNGTILAYGYGTDSRIDPAAPRPCYACPSMCSPGPCGIGKASVLDAMVTVFKRSFKAHDVVNDDVFENGAFSLTRRMSKYVVVYQDFLRFRTNYGEPNIVFFAAFATPLDTSLGRDGIVQIVIGVVIIILCMFLLGGVAMVAVNQMLRVVEVISRLSTHAATYDTEQMREVLDRQKPGALVRLITSAEIINHEFQRILTNLNLYRPFLPQSLLTKGDYASDGWAERPTLMHRETGMGREAADDFSVEFEDMCVGASMMHLNNALERLGTNRMENSRLMQRGFHRTKSTILVVSLTNVALDAGDSVEVVDRFVQTVLNHAAYANGVVEAIEFQKVVVSFNSHFPVPRHQEKACLCALAMREAFRESGCRVCVGIASGYNYVGTTGTDQHKARIIMGESVVVAHALTTLNQQLGYSIFATDAVVFEALVTAVAVDVVQLYFEHNHKWEQYGVSEIVGNRHAVLSADMQLVKSVFKLVRYRQAQDALEMMRDYVSNAAERRETLSWPVCRLRSLVEHQQALIKTGYRRRRRLWETLECEDVMQSHLCEAKGQGTPVPPPPVPQRRTPAVSASAPEVPLATAATAATSTGNTVSADFAFVASDTFRPGGEAAMARALVDEHHKADSRRVVVPTAAADGSTEALFPVFMVKDDDDSRTSGMSDNEVEGNALVADALQLTAVSPVLVPHSPSSVRTKNLASLVLMATAPAVNTSSNFASHESSPVLRPCASNEAAPSGSYIGSHVSSYLQRSLMERQATAVPSPPPVPSVPPVPVIRVPETEVALSAETSVTTTATQNTNRDGERDASVLVKRSGDFSGASGRSRQPHCELPTTIVCVGGQAFHRTTQLIGRGAFGEVYLVIAETGSLGAMKAFPLSGNNTAELIREVETLSQMRHDNIVGYDCCAVQDGFFFIICEYLAAGSLGSLIQKLGAVPERAARKYARDLLFGLGYLHEHSWLHCDLKPDNVLMSSDGTCKLADFGAATLGRSFMGAMAVRGTVRFTAPEALLGTWSKEADIYSYGMTVAQMVTGVHPWHAYSEPDHLFVARYVGEIQHSLQTGAPCAMQPDLPTTMQDEELQNAIHRCCHFDPAQRPTVEELVTFLS